MPIKKILPAKQKHLDDNERRIIAFRMAEGIAPTRIAVELGRDKSTVLAAIRKDEKVKAWIEEQRESLAELFEDTARRALLGITEEKIEKASARDLGIIAGVSIDKHRLITGQSTSNALMIYATAVELANRPVRKETTS